MKKINLKNTLCIYVNGELVAIYEVKHTIADVTAALKDYGYFNEYSKDDWKDGIGDNKSHCLKDVAQDILDDYEFHYATDDKSIWISWIRWT